MMKEIDDLLSEECKQASDELTSKLNEGGTGSEELEILCLKYPNCESTLRGIFETWGKLDNLKVPQANSGRRDRFYKMLGDFERENDQKTIPISKLRTHDFSSILKLVAVLIIGIFIGVLSTNYNGSINSDSDPSKDSAILTSLVSSSTTERLAALQSIKSIDSPEDQVFEALYQAIINDPNINVRLSSIEAILHFADQPAARSKLIQALVYQDSPIVQMTLAEVIIRLQEEGAIEELRTLLKNNQLDPEVKMHLQETLDTL
ncbi:MAG: HEAT repeat domain-containing protein [Cyclobacteriaceae bacterium]